MLRSKYIQGTEIQMGNNTLGGCETIYHERDPRRIMGDITKLLD